MKAGSRGAMSGPKMAQKANRRMSAAPKIARGLRKSEPVRFEMVLGMGLSSSLRHYVGRYIKSHFYQFAVKRVGVGDTDDKYPAPVVFHFLSNTSHHLFLAGVLGIERTVFMQHGWRIWIVRQGAIVGRMTDLWPAAAERLVVRRTDSCKI